MSFVNMSEVITSSLKRRLGGGIERKPFEELLEALIVHDIVAESTQRGSDELVC